jgi:hypothetical protein
VGHTDPASGNLVLRRDDTFTYTVSDAVGLCSTRLPPLATIGGEPITGGGTVRDRRSDPRIHRRLRRPH